MGTKSKKIKSRKENSTFNNCVIEIKKPSNKLENNLNNSFNKINKLDLLNNITYQTNQSNKKIKHKNTFSFLKNKIFIIYSLSFSIVICLSVSISFPIALSNLKQENVELNTSNQNKQYYSQLKYMNELSNSEKINIWNSYVNQSDLRWEFKQGQINILNYIRNNFDFFKDPNEFSLIQGTRLSLKELLFDFMFEDLINEWNQYVDIFMNNHWNKSFLDLNSKKEIFLFSTENINPILSLHYDWNGIPTKENQSGITTNNINIKFEVNANNNFQMSMKLPYSSILEKPYKPYPSQANYINAPFVFAIKKGKDNISENNGWLYNIRPINNTLKIGIDYSPGFYNFNNWILNYLDTLDLEELN